MLMVLGQLPFPNQTGTLTAPVQVRSKADILAFKNLGNMVTVGVLCQCAKNTLYVSLLDDRIKKNMAEDKYTTCQLSSYLVAFIVT